MKRTLLAAAATLALAGCQDRRGQTDWTRTLLLGAGVGTAAAVLGGAVTDSNRGQQWGQHHHAWGGRPSHAWGGSAWPSTGWGGGASPGWGVPQYGSGWGRQSYVPPVASGYGYGYGGGYGSGGGHRGWGW